MGSFCLMLIFLSHSIPDSWTSPTFYTGHPPAGSLWPLRDLRPQAVPVLEGLAKIDRLRNPALTKFHNSRIHSELTNLGSLKLRPYYLDHSKIDNGISQSLRPYFTSPLHNEWVGRCLKGERCAQITQDPTYLENGENENRELARGAAEDEPEDIAQVQEMKGAHDMPTEFPRQADEGDGSSGSQSSSDNVGNPLEGDGSSLEKNSRQEQPNLYDSEQFANIQNEPVVTQVHLENLPSVDNDEYTGDPITKRVEASEPENLRDATEGQYILEETTPDLQVPGEANLINSTELIEPEKEIPDLIKQDNTGYNQSIQQKEENIPEPSDSTSQLGVANVDTTGDKRLEEESRNALFNHENMPSIPPVSDSQSRSGYISSQPDQEIKFVSPERISNNDILAKVDGVAVHDTSSRKASEKPKGTSRADKILKIPISITDLGPKTDHTTGSIPKGPVLRQPGESAEKKREPIVISLNIFRDGDLSGSTVPNILNNSSSLGIVQGPNLTHSSPVTIHVQPITHHHYYNSPYITPPTANRINLLSSEPNRSRQMRHPKLTGSDLNSYTAPILTAGPNSHPSASTSEGGTSSEGIGADSEWDSVDRLASEFIGGESQNRNATEKRESLYRSDNYQDIGSKVISTSYPDESTATDSFSDPTTGQETKYAYLPTRNSTDSNIVYLFVGGQWSVNFKEPPVVDPQQAFRPESRQKLAVLPGMDAQKFQNTLYQRVGNPRQFFSRQPVYSNNYKMPMYGDPQVPVPNYFTRPLNSARSSVDPTDGGPLQVLDLPADEGMNNRWMFNYVYPFPPSQTPSAFTSYYSSPDSSFPTSVHPGQILGGQLNYEDSLVNFPMKNHHASPVRDDGVNEEKMTPELFMQHDIDLADMSLVGLQLLSAAQSPEISLLDSSLRRQPVDKNSIQIPSRDSSGTSSLVWRNTVGSRQSNSASYFRRKQPQNWQNSQQFRPEQDKLWPEQDKLFPDMVPSTWDAPDSDRPGQQSFSENLVTSSPQNQRPSGTPTSPYWPSHSSGDFDFVSGQYVFVRPRSSIETIGNSSGYRQGSRCPPTTVY